MHPDGFKNQVLNGDQESWQLMKQWFEDDPEGMREVYEACVRDMKARKEQSK